MFSIISNSLIAVSLLSFTDASISFDLVCKVVYFQSICLSVEWQPLISLLYCHHQMIQFLAIKGQFVDIYSRFELFLLLL